MARDTSDAQWWRPDNPAGPVCGYTVSGVTCEKTGTHHCEPRASKPVTFMAKYLKHIKGTRERTPLVLEEWQEWDIVRPLFGEVRYDAELSRYVRRYRVAYVVISRKNGKSMLASALLLYALLADGEASAEVYTAAATTKQARVIFDPAQRMVALNPDLAKRVVHNRNERRLSVALTGSWLEVLTADADTALGRSPHFFVLDEVLALPNDRIWTAMVTATGTRTQELCMAITTETDESSSFATNLIDHAVEVQAHPEKEPHVFSFVRKFPTRTEELDALRERFPDHPDLPVSIDPWDEQNWYWSNPGLIHSTRHPDGFKSLESMRRAALEANGDQRKTAAFLQFSLNARSQSAYSFIPSDLWQANTGTLALTPQHAEEIADRERGRWYGGLDLSSKLDMTAWCLYSDTGVVLWRFWIPEDVVATLDDQTGGSFGQWVKDGWVTATEGNTIDYAAVEAQITADAARWAVDTAVYDRWGGEGTRQRIEADSGLTLLESGTTYQQMTAPMHEAVRALKAREVSHLGNPAAAWMAASLKGKTPTDDPDRVRPVKPDRATGVRIDGMVAWLFAVDGRMIDESQPRSVYEGDHAKVSALS